MTGSTRHRECECEMWMYAGQGAWLNVVFCRGSVKWQTSVLIRDALLGSVPQQANTTLQPALRETYIHTNTLAKMSCSADCCPFVCVVLCLTHQMSSVCCPSLSWIDRHLCILPPGVSVMSHYNPFQKSSHVLTQISLPAYLVHYTNW